MRCESNSGDQRAHLRWKKEHIHDQGRKSPVHSKDAHQGQAENGTSRSSGGRSSLSTRLNISLPGIERKVAQALIAEAHQICPYSKATRGNIDLAINLV
jgi:organic hydroperoxide reductase OsmC/OhrA